MEFRDPILQEFNRRVVGNFAVIGDETRLELDICFWCIHLGRVAEAEKATQMLLRHSSASMWTIDLVGLDVESEMPICAINGIQRPSHNLALSLLHLLILSGVLEASLAR